MRYDSYWIEELPYCLGLVREHGDANVGRTAKAVQSYLRCQAGTAARHKMPDWLGSALRAAADAIEVSQWTGAYEILDRAAVHMAGRA